MKSTIDPIVWDYAKSNDLMIVSKDADMHDLSLVFGNPPLCYLDSAWQLFDFTG